MLHLGPLRVGEQSVRYPLSIHDKSSLALFRSDRRKTIQDTTEIHEETSIGHLTLLGSGTLSY